ncbi:IclR family transcriptional regulator [Pseudoduganella chitinolytica]|uniref:IclR family transcriptional regulator n=1 Tax=Pseudoduganella chitinolytica TaxID=34070 RepID=A0ABY8BAF6_9BURK|nr:IclR family transcriptional regulator [Pseudoduganella chitinolytica]WEF32892.1 IclR family transcriptional regulator [Pseudoduganella chitinolytica]
MQDGELNPAKGGQHLADDPTQDPAQDLADTQEGSRNNEDRYYITALARGLEVLACFRRADKSLTNQQIAERCGLPKSTVTRFTYTLTKLGYLAQENNGRYMLGTATLGLGSAMLARLDIRQLARPMMQELAEFSGTTVSIAMRDRLSMIYVEVCRSTAALALALQVGSRLPLAASAIGRAYLARASEQERKDILARSQELDEMAHGALRVGLERGLADYREYGCATSFGDWQKDVNGIAVGFMPIGGSQLMSMNCGGPSSSVSKEFLLDEVRPRLIEIARRLES